MVITLFILKQSSLRILAHFAKNHDFRPSQTHPWCIAQIRPTDAIEIESVWLFFCMVQPVDRHQQVGTKVAMVTSIDNKSVWYMNLGFTWDARFDGAKPISYAAGREAA